MSLRLAYILAIFILALTSFGVSFAHENGHEVVSPVKYVSASEAQDLLIANPEIQVLDVRTKGEFNRAHIEGAIRINYFSTKFKKKLRALDKNTPYLVHCKSGHRSNRAVKTMQKLGFTNIVHLDGGYDAWKKLPDVLKDISSPE